MGRIIQTSFRMEENLYKEYKKWLIDNGYRSINQHINEVVEEIIKKKTKAQCKESTGRKTLTLKKS